MEIISPEQMYIPKNKMPKFVNQHVSLKKLKTEMRLRSFSPTTSKVYIFYNEKFLEFIKKNPEDITEDDIKEFLAYMMEERDVSGNSIALIKASLKFYYSGILGKNISIIKTPKSAKKLPVVLTKEEVKLLLDSTYNIKHRLLIELLYSSGLRLSECINLKYSDLDLKQNLGWVRMGKGSKDRIFIISEIFKNDLMRFRSEIGFNEDGHVFNVKGRKMCPRSIQQAIKNAAIRAGLKKDIHVHSLRHSFATHLLEDGVDIRKIQCLLGHSNLQTTMIYTQVSTDEIKKIRSPLDLITQ